ncbi:MAG TPA: ABC transporter permease [Flavisolibacter sp.]|jgi:putative ABC transport system permease protein|nr:ABC transporter permease [Flavisolibacter sp.]
MLKNYFVTTLRNLSRNKIFSLINLSGLSVGLACCLLIFLYAKDEVSYDRFLQNVDQIYRITAVAHRQDGNTDKMGVAGMMPGPTFHREIPEIKTFVRLQQDGFTVRKGAEVFQQDALAVDSNFFSVFSFPLLQGAPQTVLNDPYSVVLSEETAKKYFGTANAVGQTLQLKNDSTFHTFTVKGIAKNAPQNSSIKFNMLVPMSFKRLTENDQHWLNFYLNTFVVLPPGAQPKAIEAKMAASFARNAGNELKEAREKYNMKETYSFHLQPFLDMHLSQDFKAENGLTDGSNPVYSYILSGIALFIFLIACINFINLTIARSMKRAKEIGVRKVMGSQRRQLVFQFLGESFLLSFMAFLLAIILVNLLLPLFNSVANKALSFSYLLDAKLIAGFTGMFLLTGLLAGIYPALVLSRFNPVETLYGKLRFGGRNLLAKSLVVLQFSLATFLVIATVIIYSQFNYLVNFDLGYNDKHVAVLKAGPINREKLAIIRSRFLQNPAITNISFDQGGRWGTMARINGNQDVSFDMKVIDENYLGLLQIPVVKGRNFSAGFPTDTASGVIVNESFVKMAGWKEPVGAVVDFYYNNKKYNVIGVVKDYHYASLNEKIGPQIFVSNPKYPLRDIYLKVQEDKIAEVLPFLQKTFKQLFPFQPYQYQFKDVDNAQQYAAEKKWKQIVSFGAVLTIFISCIGLFGLSLLAAERRTKEIGIRKVLGASVAVITRTLSVSFLQLVLLSALIAIPAAALFMQQWLENYPYRVELRWWMYGLATLLIFLVALLTISYQSVKAAMANPVKNLRTE